MKRKRFTEEQIIKALKEADGGAEIRDVCRRAAFLCPALMARSVNFVAAAR